MCVSVRDGQTGGLVRTGDSGLFDVDEVWLEETLWGLETLRADLDDAPVWQLEVHTRR